MSAIARWCISHRFAVIAAWVIVLIGLSALAQAAKSDYNNSFSVPGTGSATAQQLLARTIPARSGDPDTIVWQVRAGTVRNPAVVARMSRVLNRISKFPEVASVTSPYGPGGAGQISHDGRIAYATVGFARQAGNLAKADVTRVIDAADAAREPGLEVQLGGQAIENTEKPPLSVSSAVGVLAAAIVLFIALGSLLAMLLPVMTAIAGAISGLMGIVLLTHVVNVVDLAPILGALIGLGVGIDYALFIVTRHRRGLEAGLTPEEAAVTAIDTSGRAVLFAGGTVCACMLGILVLGFSFLNGLAIACSLTVACTVLAAVTLLPALLGVFGQRVLSGRQRRRLSAQPEAAVKEASGAWTRWADTVQRRPAALAAVAAVVMLVLALPVLHLRLAISDQASDPASSTTRQAYDLLAKGFGPGFNGPLVLVAQASSPADTAALQSLVTRLPSVGDVAGVKTIAAAGGTRVIQVTPRTSPQDTATFALIDTLRDKTIPAAARDTSLRVYIGGPSATYADFTAAVNAKFPWFLITIIGLSFLLLVVAFRSLLIPATAAMMNLLAAAASFGVATAFFQWGWGTSALGMGAASPVEAFLPVFILPILFGLSTDYQVFLVSQMNEEWVRSHDNGRAVRAGQVGTARVITAAATIMICVFVTFSLMNNRDIAEFGIGLAAAVALDAFILRTILVPAVMHMSGNANWSLPGWLDRRLPRLAIEPGEETPVLRPHKTANPDPRMPATES
jgi:putative drug exporter of the RND superfamily